MEYQFTERELDVMAVLWRRGSATAAEVRSELEVDLAYTTVLTVLRILEEKGYARHEEEGRTHRFHPVVGRAEAGASAVRRLVRKVFDGSTGLLLTQLLEGGTLDAAEKARLRRLLDERTEERGGA